MSEMEPTSVPLPPDNDLEIQAEAVGIPLRTPAEASTHSSVSTKQPTAASLLLSTFLSLTVVLVLLVALRYMLPSLLEFSRYSWHRGQLRAEYEMAGHQLESVSWEGLSTISQTVAHGSVNRAQ